MNPSYIHYKLLMLLHLVRSVCPLSSSSAIDGTMASEDRDALTELEVGVHWMGGSLRKALRATDVSRLV